MIDIIPVPGCSAPTVCIPAFGFFINQLSMMKYLTIFSPMALIRGNKANRTVPMDTVIPKDKLGHPPAGGLDRFKSGFRIVRPIFTRSKKSLRIGIVIADSRPTERSHNPQRFELGVECRSFLGRTIVRMQHKRLEQTPLGQNSLVNEGGRIAGTFPVKHLPSDDFSAEHIHDHVKVKKHAANGSGQPRNIPRPNLVGTSCTKSLRRSAFSRFLAAAPMVLFIDLVKNSV